MTGQNIEQGTLNEGSSGSGRRQAEHETLNIEQGTK